MVLLSSILKPSIWPTLNRLHEESHFDRGPYGVSRSDRLNVDEFVWDEEIENAAPSNDHGRTNPAI